MQCNRCRGCQSVCHTLVWRNLPYRLRHSGRKSVKIKNPSKHSAQKERNNCTSTTYPVKQKAKTFPFIITDKTTSVVLRCPAKPCLTVSARNCRVKHAERTLIWVNQRMHLNGQRAENIVLAFLRRPCDPLMDGKRCFVCRRKCYSFFFRFNSSARCCVHSLSYKSTLLSLSLFLLHTLSLFRSPQSQCPLCMRRPVQRWQGASVCCDAPCYNVPDYF